MKKITTVLAVSTALVLAVTGCGRSDEDPGQAQTAVSVDDSPASGDITVWAMGGEADNLPPFLDAFTQDNPDAQVDVVNIPWGDVVTRVQTALAAGQGPDVIMLGSSLNPSIAAAGALQPVPEGLVEDGDFFDALVDTATLDDTMYGVPWYVETRVLYYRSDLAAQAGLSAPTNWQELHDFAAGMKAGAGAQYGIQMPVGVADGTTQMLLPFLAQAGGEPVDTDASAYDLDSSEMVTALDYYRSFFADGLANSAGYGDSSAADFVNGVAPAFISGPWQIGTLTDLQGAQWVQDNVTTTVVPSGAAGNDSYIGGANWGVFADSDNAESAWKLIRWLTQPETEQEYFDQFGALPASRDAWDYAPLADDPRASIIGDQLENTVAAPSVATWAEMAAFTETETEKLALGTASAEDVAATIQAKGEALGLGD